MPQRPNRLRDFTEGLSTGQQFAAPIVQGLYRGQDMDFRMQQFEEQKRQDAIRNALSERLRQMQESQFNNTVQNQQTRLLMTPGVTKGLPGPYPDIKTLPGGLTYSPTAANAQEIAGQQQLTDSQLPEQNRIAGLALQDAPLSQIQQSAPEGLAPSASDIFAAEKMKQGLNTKLSPGGSLVGPQGNVIATAPKPQATVGEVDPAVLKGAVDLYKKTGQIPPFGLGNNALRPAFYAAIGNDENAIGEGQTNKAVRSGMSKALANQQTIYQATKTSLGTLDKQLDLADQYSKKVDRTGSPVLNKYLLYLKGQVAGDADTQALENVVTTASNEFAKILNGASASIAGNTVSSADDAKRMLHASIADGTFQKITQLMRQESDFRTQSYKETIDGLQKDLGSVGSQSSQPIQSGRFTVKEVK